jgi:gluconolactonase
LLIAGGCGAPRHRADEGEQPKTKPEAKPRSHDAAIGDADTDAGRSADPGDEDGGADDDDGITAQRFGVPVLVASGFTLAEGPLWDPCGKRLLFTDVTASVVHTLAADGEVGVLIEDTKNANGLAYDIDGALILAQMGGAPGHIARRMQDGSLVQLDPEDSALHTPDDVIVRSDGTIYFSDGDFPPIGALNFGALPVYALGPHTNGLVDVGSVAGPNGVELSPDEKTLYVDAYFEGSVVKFDLAADGTTSNKTVFAAGLSTPDSLCLDADGNLYVGVRSGLAVFRPDGTAVGVIAVPVTQGVTNCAFGGDDGKTLYITAWDTLWKLDAMPIPGLDFQVNRERVKCDD